VLCTVQPVPFQLSAKVTQASPLKYWPTAVQAVLDGHDNLERVLPVAPGGLGVLCTVQLTPSQPSTKLTKAPEPFVYSPTAVQAALDEHDTPWSCPLLTCGARADWMRESAARAMLGVVQTAATTTITAPLSPKTERRERSNPVRRKAATRHGHFRHKAEQSEPNIPGARREADNLSRLILQGAEHRWQDPRAAGAVPHGR
jgi:hypothetical protein